MINWYDRYPAQELTSRENSAGLPVTQGSTEMPGAIATHLAQYVRPIHTMRAVTHPADGSSYPTDAGEFRLVPVYPTHGGWTPRSATGRTQFGYIVIRGGLAWGANVNMAIPLARFYEGRIPSSEVEGPGGEDAYLRSRHAAYQVTGGRTNLALGRSPSPDMVGADAPMARFVFLGTESGFPLSERDAFHVIDYTTFVDGRGTGGRVQEFAGPYEQPLRSLGRDRDGRYDRGQLHYRGWEILGKGDDVAYYVPYATIYSSPERAAGGYLFGDGGFADIPEVPLHDHGETSRPSSAQLRNRLRADRTLYGAYRRVVASWAGSAHADTPGLPGRFITSHESTWHCAISGLYYELDGDRLPGTYNTTAAPVRSFTQVGDGRELSKQGYLSVAARGRRVKMFARARRCTEVAVPGMPSEWMPNGEWVYSALQTLRSSDNGGDEPVATNFQLPLSWSTHVSPEYPSYVAPGDMILIELWWAPEGPGTPELHYYTIFEPELPGLIPPT